MQQMKVFYPHQEDDAPELVRDAISILSSECYQSGPEGYVPFDVVENPSGEEEGIGWITDKQAQAITEWLLNNGAVVGDSVLISWSY